MLYDLNPWGTDLAIDTTKVSAVRLLFIKGTEGTSQPGNEFRVRMVCDGCPVDIVFPEKNRVEAYRLKSALWEFLRKNCGE